MSDQLGGPVPQLKCLGGRRAPWKFYLGDHLDLLVLGTPTKKLGSPNPWNFPYSTALQPCSYWKYDTLHAIVECGSAFLDNISKGNANSSRTTHTLNIYGGTIDVRFVLSSKGALVCNSSVSVTVLNRTSPSLCTHFLLIHYSTFGRILDILIVHVVLLAIPGETVYEMLHELLHDVIHKVVTSKI